MDPSPATDDAQDYTTRVVTEIATQYAVDGVHLDYLRFPTDAFDYSRATLTAFRAQHATAAPVADRQRLDARAVMSRPCGRRSCRKAGTMYRRDRLTALATRLVASVRKARPQAIASVAVGRSADEAATYRFQDWRSWGAAETFEPRAVPDDLHGGRAGVRRPAREGAPCRRGPRRSGLASALYKLTVAGTADRLRAVRRARAAGFVLFSYDNLANAPGRPSDYFAALRPFLIERPAGEGLLR